MSDCVFQKFVKRRTLLLQLRAIDMSIDKWKQIVYHGAQELGRFDCECCTRYINALCINCPIYEFGGDPGCKQTPYYDWAKYFSRGTKRSVINKETQDLANRELTFLYEVQRWLICKIYH